MSQRLTLTRNQQLIWYAQRLLPGVPLYDSAFEFTIDGPLDVPVFMRAFERLVGETDVMRLVVDDRDGESSARILESPRAGIEYCDLTSLDDPQQAAARQIDRQLGQTLDPAHRLYESILLKLAADRFCWCLRVNHLIVDGWSIGVLFRRQQAFYLSELNGEVTEPVPRWQDYVEYEETCRGSADGLKCAEHWSDRTQTATRPTRFYAGRVSQPQPRHTRVCESLGHERTQSVRSLAETEGFRAMTPDLSTFNVLTTALLVWLWRLERATPLTIGVTSHGRVGKRFHETVGLFMQILPYQVAISEADSFRSLARKVSAESLMFLRHAAPGVATPESGRSFDVALNFIPVQFGQFCGFPTSVQWRQNGFDDPHRRLGITVHDFNGSGSLDLIVDFNDAAFTEAGRRSALCHFETTLDCMLRDPDLPLSSLDLITERDRLRFEKELSGAESTVPVPADLWAAFSEVCRKSPSSLAVQSWDGQLTWAELHHRAESLGGQLRSDGVGPGTVVPLVAQRGRTFVEGALGILAAGAAFLPVDPELPDERIAWMIADAGAPLIVRDVAGQAQAEPVRVSGERRVTSDETAQLAYVIYTSGSTGDPNGVMVGHESVFNLLADMETLAPLPDRARCSWWTNVGFDVAIYELFSALLYGRTLVIPADEIRVSPDDLFVWLRDERIDSAYLPPFVLAALHQWLADGGQLHLSRLLVGVEPIPQHLLAALARRLAPGRVINGYGPTEATVCATLQLVNPDDRSDGPTPIGRPVSNSRCLILDGDFTPVPAGVAGELYIAGKGLAEGYFGRPELTSRRFVPDPTRATRETFYRTGDVVRLRDDGALEFHGRTDRQLKLHGHRIEPGEVVSCLTQHPDVTDCAVVSATVEKKPGLAAYYTSSVQVDRDQLRTFVARRLPAYMVPAALVQLDSIPRTNNSKVDYEALPPIAGADSEQVRDFVEPQTAVERTLAKIWSDVLRTPRIGAKDNFFDLGGDSIMAIQIAAKARRAGLNLKVSQLFEHPCIDELSVVAGTQLGATAEQGIVSGDTPLAPIQHWFFAQELEGAEHWNHSVLVSLPEDVDPELLEQAIHRVVLHHDALRLSFVKTGGSWHSANLAGVSRSPLAVYDLREVVAADLQPLDVVEATLHESLDLAAGNLFCAAVIRDEGVPPRLLMVAHHLVIDAISWSFVLEDMIGAYTSLRRGEPILLPPKTTSFRQWTTRLAELAGEETMQDGRDTWLETARVAPLVIPLDRASHGVNDVGSSELISMELDDASTSRLLQVSGQRRYSVHEVLTAALVTTLADWTGQHRFRIDTEGHGRDSVADDLDVSRTVGWFTSLYPLAFDLAGLSSPATTLRCVQETLRRIPFGGVRYGVLAYLGSEQKLAEQLTTSPASPLLFNDLGRVDQLEQTSSGFALCRPLSLSRSRRGRRKYALEVSTVIFTGRLSVQWVFSRELHDASTIKAQAELFLANLMALVDHCCPAGRERTAEDFPLARLNADKLSRLEAALRKSDRARGVPR